MNYQALNSRNMKIKTLSLLSLWLLLMLPEAIQAGLPGFNHGYVYSRAAITNDQGQYTWSRYNPENGEYLGDIGVAGDSLNPAQWRVMSGDTYRSIIKQKRDLHNSQPDLELISRADYESADLLLANGEEKASKPSLSATTAYVSILPQTRRLIDDPQSLILAQYPVNPDISVGDNIVSILYQYRGDGIGSIRLQSPDRIGFKAAFTKDADGNAVPTDEYNVNKFRSGEFQPIAPLEGVVIESAQRPGGGITDETGHYSALWMYPACPIFSMEYTNKLTAKLYYKRFNPRQQSRINYTYTAQKTLYDYCVGDFFMVPFFGPIPLGLGHINVNPNAFSFPIDRSYLSGVAQLTSNVEVVNDRVELKEGQVSVVDTTEYLADDPDNSSTTSDYYDFDRDGIPDTVQAGHLEDKPIDEGADACEAKGKTQKFVSGDPEEVQGVWLSRSGYTKENCQPDLTRVIDSNSYLDLTNQGLLSKIGAEDLRDTDIYIVRVSDGKLISERIGLNEYERKRISDLGEDRAKNQFFYTLEMRGSKLAQTLTETNYSNSNFEDWQSVKGMNPELHQREADHVQPGDQLRIYAINRATGYMGHVDTTYDISSNDNSLLGSNIDPIIMGPPNLRIKVERDYKIDKGASASEDTITRLIGFEGASLTSDTLVAITTEWLDHEGRPLPESLQGAGYTGRIAILSGDKTLPNDDQGVYQFAIEPGQRLQVLQLPNALSDSEHFYIHVSGQPETGQAIFAGSTDNTRRGDGVDFKSTGQNPGILEKRPDHYVPFLVPVYDEESTELQTQAYRLMKETDPDTYDKAPDPIYKWVYRPEMQFTSYDLKIDEINNSQDTDGNGSIDTNETIDIFNQEVPVITSESVIDILYNLSTTDLLPLDYFNAGEEKELIFKVGEQEIKASMGEDQEISFDDLSHLSLLNPDDFLTISLYANNDAGNVLWEFAFGLSPDLAPTDAIVNADNGSIDLVAYLPTSLAPPSDTEDLPNVTLNWTVSGNGGSLMHSSTESRVGVFNNRLITSHTSDDEFFVTVEIAASEDKHFAEGTKKEYGPFTVVPGEPKSIQLNAANNSLLTDGEDKTTLTAVVFDQYNNEVSDGTAVQWSTGYGGALVNEIVQTSAGTATTEYQSSYETTPTTIAARSGLASGSITVNKRAFDFSVNASANSLTADSDETISITVNASEAPSQPIAISWYSSRGEISGDQILSGTTATAVLSADKIPGDGQVVVNIAGVKKSIDVTHTAQAIGMLTFSNPAIVGGAAGGSATVETLRGGDSVHNYITDTSANVKGIPGTQFTLTAGGFYTPNAMPVAHFAMNEILEDTVNNPGIQYIYDHMNGAQAVVSDAVTANSHQSYTNPGASLQFSGGNLNLASDPSYDIVNDFFLNIRFRTESTGTQTLIRKATASGEAYSLSIVNDNGSSRVQAQITTDSGIYTLLSDTVIATNSWYITGIRIRNGQLELGVNQERKSIQAPGNIINHGFSSAIRIGEGFVGQIDDTKFGSDKASNALVKFAGGVTSQSATVGANGTANFNISSSGVSVNAPMRIGFTATYTSALGQIETREIRIASKLFNRMTGLPGIEDVYAQTVNINENEDGLAVVDGDTFGNVMEVMKNAGQEVLDFTKSALHFLYEMSGFSDIYTLLNAVYMWWDDKWDEVNKLDLAFAGIGLTLSVVAIITAPTSGGAGLVAAASLKGVLKGLRATLKELVTDPVTLLKAGGTAVRWTVDLIKEFLKGNRELAIKKLGDLGHAITTMLKDLSGKTILLFSTVVRSTKNLNNFLQLIYISSKQCSLAYNGYSQGTMYAFSPIYQRTLGPAAILLLPEEAYAAPSSICGQTLVDMVSNILTGIADSRKSKVFDNISGIIKGLSDAGHLSVNAETINTIKKLVENGHGDLLETMVRNVADGKIKWIGRVDFDTLKLNDVAVRKFKNSNNEILLNDSVFDVFVKSLDELTTISSRADAEFLINALKAQKDGKVSMISLRGMFGELESLKAIKGSQEYSGAVLKQVNNRVDVVGKTGKLHNVQGVDSVWDLPDGRELFVESKNWAKITTKADRLERLNAMKKQFRKHVKENVGKHIKGKYNAVRKKTEMVWDGDKAPVLHYELRGSFFNSSHTTVKTSVEDIRKEFREIIETDTEEVFRDLREILHYGKPDFETKLNEFLKINDYPDLLPPWSS